MILFSLAKIKLIYFTLFLVLLCIKDYISCMSGAVL